MSEKVNWTEAQSAAIGADPCTILVSAAAGSGKTAVLTERLAKKIADKNDPLTVENAVVVTFTKAAAGELKERICAKLNEQLAKKPDKRLFAQITALPSARISTVHSFCYGLIREHAHRLGLSPDVRIADDFQSGAFKKDAARAVIRGYFENEAGMTEHDRGDFLLLCQLLGVRLDDKTLSDFIIELHSSLCSFPEPMKLIPRALGKLESDLGKFDAGELKLYEIGLMKALLGTLKKTLESAERELSECAEICRGTDELEKKCLPVIESELGFVRMLTSCGPENVVTAAGQAEFRQFRTKGFADPETAQKLAALRESAKKTVRAFCASVASDPAAVLKSLRTTAALERIAAALIGDFDREYRRLKEQANCIDYADLEQLTLGLLCENISFDGKNARFEPTQTAVRISQGICELYVDEYQDTNTVQDMIFRAVSPGGKMFIVGDPKQSVYAFRGAVPEIFTGYKNSFREDGADGKRKIVLSENFRCDASVIALTNTVFSLVMNLDPAQSLYQPEDMLIKAKAQESSMKAELVLIDSSDDAADTDDGEENAPSATGNAQGRFAAKKITELIGSRMLTDKGQPLSFDDVAVLARTKGTLASVKRELRAAGIPCGTDADDGFFRSAEILFVTSLLRLIDNPDDDTSLAAVLNSPVFGFTPDMLLEIRRAFPDGGFCAAAKAFCQTESDTAQALREVFGTAELLRGYSRSASVCELVKKALDLTGALNVYSAAGGHLNRERNVKFLLDKAAECDRRRDADVRMLLDELENLKSSETGSQSSAGCVQFMTFHKAKGLEFPCVFLVGLEKEYNFTDQKAQWCADPELGVGFRHFDETGILKNPSELFGLIRQKHENQLKEEEKRLLYVAMTRARQKLILVGTAKLKKKNKFFDEAQPCEKLANDAKSPLQLIAAALPDRIAAKTAADFLAGGTGRLSTDMLEVGVESADALLRAEPARAELIVPEEELLPDFDEKALARALDFEYPFETLSEIPKKTSVSELKPITDAEKEPVTMNDPAKLFERVGTSGAFAGTAAHQFMQFCDYELAQKDCEAEASRLLDEGFISEDQLDALDFGELNAFFSSPLYRRIKQSPRVHREMRFNVFLPARRLLQTDAEGDVLLQGVIDCFFENPDGTFTILDFKTDRVRSERLLKEHHAKQLEIYRLAVEKMTSRRVSELLLYSFSLSRQVSVDVSAGPSGPSEHR